MTSEHASEEPNRYDPFNTGASKRPVEERDGSRERELPEAVSPLIFRSPGEENCSS